MKANSCYYWCNKCTQVFVQLYIEKVCKIPVCEHTKSHYCNFPVKKRLPFDQKSCLSPIINTRSSVQPMDDSLDNMLSLNVFFFSAPGYNQP